MSDAREARARVRLAHRLQYGALRAIVAILTRVPWRVASAVGGTLGRLGYFPLRLRRGVVERQLAAAFPELTARQRRAVARGSYASLGRTAIEVAVLSRFPTQRVLDLFHPPTGWGHVAQHAASGRGIILVSGHIGNWELGAAYLAARGLVVEPVVRRMNNPLFDAYLLRTRRRLGYQTMYDNESVRRIPRAIAEGHVVPLLADQGVKGLASTFVPFFGRPARTPKGPAVLALRLGAPCVATAAIREADGRYRLHFRPVPVVNTGDRERDVDATVTAFTQCLEDWVREYPSQYMWQHRRWRRRPDGSLDD